MPASRMGGTCAGNSARGTSHDASLGLAARLRLRRREAGSIHGRDWSRFVRLYGHGRRAMLWHRIVPCLRIVRSWLRRHGLALNGSRTVWRYSPNPTSRMPASSGSGSPAGKPLASRM